MKSSVPVAIITMLVMIVIVLFAPFAYHFDFGPGPDSINAVLWQYIEAPWNSGYRFISPLRYLQFIFVRLLIPIQFARFLLGKSSAKWTLLSAIYSELHVGLVSLPVYISWLYQLGPFLAPDGDHLLPIFLPLPILSISVLLIVYLTKDRWDTEK